MTDHHDHHHDLKISTDTVQTGGLAKIALGAAVVGLAAFAGLGIANMGSAGDFGLRDFFLTYLCGFVFWASIPFGAVFLMLVGILTSASWGVVLRRCFLAAIKTMPILALLFIPVAVSLFVVEGKQSPYWWSDASWEGDVNVVAKEKGLRFEAIQENQHKIHDIMNPYAYLAISLFAFGAVGGMGYAAAAVSRKSEEEKDLKAYETLRKFAGPGVAIWVLTMTITCTLWVMSVEPTWASSMFPIVFGMNAFLTTLSFCIFTFYTVNADKADTMAIVKDKFRIDIGTFTLAITMVWAYASFSQYMLIWAGNLPEEITYYRKRGDHGWEYLAYFLMAFHWLIPFVTLLFREVKTNPTAMRVMCVLLFTVCAADVIWWIVPCVPHETAVLHVPMAVAAIVGVGGIWGFFFLNNLSKKAALPANHEGEFLATWGEHH